MKKFTKLLGLVLALVMAFSLMPSASAKATGEDDKILKFGSSGNDGVFNPILSSNVYDGYVNDLIFEGLVQISESGEYVPDLAEWEMSEDNKTYTFTLKDGIKFQDGTDMTAEDVAFTYKTMAHPDYNGPRAYAVSGLVGYEDFHKGDTEEFPGIEVKDEKTIAFTFEEAAVPNIQYMVFGILSKDYYAFDEWTAFEDMNAQPMGSGAMKFVEYAPKQHVLLETNEEYWDSERVPKIDGVLISEVAEESILAALESGQIDLAQPATKLENLEQLEEMGNVEIFNFLGNGYTFMQFECTTPPFNDKLVRQALMYALDREEFIKAEYKSTELASVGKAPISPVSWAFPKDVELNAYAFDLDKANELLDEAGWEMGDDNYRYKDDEMLEVTWLVYTEVSWPGRLAEMAADSWKKIGVKLNIELMDFNTVADKTMDAAVEDKPENFDIFTMGFSLDADPDLSGALFDLDLYDKGTFNASGYKNEQISALIKEGRTTFDKEKRKEIYAELSKLFTEEIPTVIVAYRNELWGVNKRVKNLTPSTYLTWVEFIHDVEIEN